MFRSLENSSFPYIIHCLSYTVIQIYVTFMILEVSTVVKV